jgi:predicted component of type VI protein secretion system
MATLERVVAGEVLEAFRLDGPIAVIGRDNSCDVVLKGNGVSRRHCMVCRAKDGGWYLEDLSSANGTLLNGAMLKDRSCLNEGDKFIVMGHILVFSTADKPAAVQPQVSEQSSGMPGTPGDAEYPPTTKVDPAELSRRLDALLKKNKLSFEDGVAEARQPEDPACRRSSTNPKKKS